MDPTQAKANPLIPTSLKRTDDRKLQIEWADGVVHAIPFRLLRDECGCAHCRAAQESTAAPETSGQLPVLSLAESQPIQLVSMEPVGHYGYRLGFSDGHQTGIYSIEQLRRLGEQASDPSDEDVGNGARPNL